MVAASKSGIYRLRSNDSGATFGKKVKVCDLSGPVGRRRGPRIAVAGKSIVITFDSADVYATRSLDGGDTWSAPLKINRIKNCAEEGLHGMSANASGSVFVAWLDNRSGQMEVWGSFSGDGGKTWNPDQRIYASPDGHVCECCHPSVTFSPDGSVAVMWRNWLNGNRDMYVAKSKPAGSLFGPATKLGQESWKLDACPMDGGSITTNKQGQIISAWQSKGVVFRAQGPNNVDSIGPGTQPVLVFSDSAETIVVYQSDGNLIMKIGNGSKTVLEAGGAFPALVRIPKSDKIGAAWELNEQGASRVKFALIKVGL
mgnify:CR=1 FL=1